MLIVGYAFRPYDVTSLHFCCCENTLGTVIFDKLKILAVIIESDLPAVNTCIVGNLDIYGEFFTCFCFFYRRLYLKAEFVIRGGGN